jgi:hypothetical protein
MGGLRVVLVDGEIWTLPTLLRQPADGCLRILKSPTSIIPGIAASAHSVGIDIGFQLAAFSAGTPLRRGVAARSEKSRALRTQIV